MKRYVLLVLETLELKYLYDIIALVKKGAEIMRESVSREEVLNALAKDAEKIQALLDKQRNLLCLSQCPAFEEVADTQLYGFSKEVHLAQSCGLISGKEGQEIIKNLEHILSDIYVTAGEDK
ncbi:DUF1507 family protein [Liquorilactobacillus uvarum]|uniref:DUF1507 family protein n=1 Tax=Liquorilactobacillus uvarum TaxID=303240 RepID=UPI000A52823D|nr:DUF1507 family protein [Liquorilactobacillus uvarum]